MPPFPGGYRWAFRFWGYGFNKLEALDQSMSLLFFQQLKKRSKKKPPPDASTAKTALRSAAQKKLARIGGMRYFGIRGQGVVGSLKLHRCSDSFLCGRCTSGGFLTPRLLRAEGSWLASGGRRGLRSIPRGQGCQLSATFSRELLAGFPVIEGRVLKSLRLWIRACPSFFFSS